MTLHAHLKTNAHVTGCLVCGKPYEQLIEEAVADYLHQTAEPGETVRDRVSKRKAFLDGLESGVFTFVPSGVSQAAACDGQVHSVNYCSTQPGTQTNLLPLFEDQRHYEIQLNVNAGQIPPILQNALYLHI